MRLLVLAHGSFDTKHAKTAVGILRYSSHDVVAVVDRDQVGGDAGEVVGPVGEGVPIVGSVEAGLEHDPEGLAIGIAPVGGGLPEAWRPDLRAALEHGLTVISGLHTRIAEDPELAGVAAEHGGSIRDVRVPTRAPRIATGEALEVDAAIVTTTGTDCNSGKMTTTLELWQEARERGIDAGWVATGQTGLIIGATSGAPMDATVSDFVAGITEACVLEAAAEHDLVLVEGQASLTHPGYGGVTASILHGSFPDALVLCDVPTRTHYKFPSARPFPKRSLDAERDLCEDLLAGTTGAPVAATSLVTRDLDAEGAQEAIAEAEATLGVPAGDVLRGGRGKVLDAVLDALAKVQEQKPGATRALEAGR